MFCAGEGEAIGFPRSGFLKDLPLAKADVQDAAPMANPFSMLGWLGCAGVAALVSAAEVAPLATEVRPLGWIAFSARSPQGDWEVYAMRPDGSDRRNLSNSPDTEDFYPLFSRDGLQLLYRSMPRGQTLSGNDYGRQGRLMLARANGSEAKAVGGDGEFTWATWSPDGRQILTLQPKGFAIVDLASKQVVRTFPRGGFYQQPTWSPDGKALVGVSNGFNTGWSIARLELATLQANAVSVADCCTPDWSANGERIVFSRRRPHAGENGGYGWTELWQARPDGHAASLVYAEVGRHLYGSHVSPDGRYVLFTGNLREDGDPANQGAPMGLARLTDAPMIAEHPQLRQVYPQAKAAQVLVLPAGHEPCWTSSQAPGLPR
jgi:Tol biopolymer transport system component